MSTTVNRLLVVDGPLKGRVFEVPVNGLRLGRSSSCEIAVTDPALSRNHCLFELRGEKICVTDLASANGTAVNDETLGTETRELKLGDLVVAGETTLKVVDETGGVDASAPQIDLGLGQKADDGAAARKGSPMRILLWVVAAAAVAGAAALILSNPGAAVPVDEPKEVPKEKPVLRSVAFEKVEADQDGIYRYALALDAKGVLTVEIDDVPKENRHVRKSAQLKQEAQAHLAGMFDNPEIYKLAPEYTGVPLKAGTLKNFALRIVRGSQVFATTIENMPEPDEFRRLREQLEMFAKNELGIWAIQFSAEKLVEMSKESRRIGDAKWEERDVQYGNVSAALSAYDEALFYLETVNPKPEFYGELANRQREVKAELEKRYRDQRFLADRAINLADWKTALHELRILCEMVPNPKDPRHSEANGKLLDVESRMKKGVK